MEQESTKVNDMYTEALLMNIISSFVMIYTENARLKKLAIFSLKLPKTGTMY